VSILSVNERFQERRSIETADERQHSRSWLLETSDKSDDGATILASNAIPFVGSIHPNDTFARLVSREPVAFAGSHFWIVNASYSTNVTITDDPLSDPASFEWDSEQFQQVAYKDRDGDAIVNSAGDLFDPPPMVDQSRRTVIVSKNMAVLPSWIMDLEDAINSDTVILDGLTVAPKLAKCQKVRVGGWNSRNNIPYRVVSVIIHLSREGWDISPLDQGFRYKDGTEMKNISNDGDSGLPTAPVLLDGSGGVLTDPKPDNAVFLDFGYYKLRSFSILPLF